MTKALDCALRLLTRREHGRQELKDKLTRKGYTLKESEEACHKCKNLGLQSDERFVEMLCNARIRQGYGPLRISQELKAKQIDSDLIAAMLSQYQETWEALALSVWRKKFKEQDNLSVHDIQKQQRFLFYRGFSSETILNLFSGVR